MKRIALLCAAAVISSGGATLAATIKIPAGTQYTDTKGSPVAFGLVMYRTNGRFNAPACVDATCTAQHPQPISLDRNGRTRSDAFIPPTAIPLVSRNGRDFHNLLPPSIQ